MGDLSGAEIGLGLFNGGHPGRLLLGTLASSRSASLVRRRRRGLSQAAGKQNSKQNRKQES